jgi:hypothetical protein
MASYLNGKKQEGGRTIEPVARLVTYSSDQFTRYTATRWEDGTTSCNCPGWTRGEPKSDFRGCKHSKRVATMTEDLDETASKPKVKTVVKTVVKEVIVYRDAVVAPPPPRPGGHRPLPRGITFEGDD